MIGQNADLKNKKAWFLPGFCFCVIVFSALPSYAQSSRDIVNRLNRLENDINTLSRAVYRGEAVDHGGAEMSPQMQAGTEIRIQQLEGEIRSLTGQVESLSHENRQLRSELERMSSDLMLRMQDLERGNTQGSYAPQGQIYNTAPAAGTPSQGGGTASSAIKYQDRSQAAAEQAYEWKSQTAKQPEIPLKAGVNRLGTINQGGSGAAPAYDEAASKYEHAFALLKNQKYDQAESVFTEFLTANPSHPLAGNAKYWLGETYYVRGQYDSAARVFAEGYQQYPKGNKAPDNLLKLGLSLASLGSADDACLALSQLEKEFPNGAGPVLLRARQEKSRLGCQ